MKKETISRPFFPKRKSPVKALYQRACRCMTCFPNTQLGSKILKHKDLFLYFVQDSLKRLRPYHGFKFQKAEFLYKTCSYVMECT